MRLLATGNISKNDPSDARSVAIAALRSADVREVRADDHAAVLKVWSKRYRDLGRARTQVACRLHQVLCELIPGGVPGEITAGQAGQVLASITPAGAVEAARCELAAELTEDLRSAGIRIRETRKKLTEAVRAAATCLTGLSGVGPVIAAAVIGDVGQVSRFPDRHRFAACTGTAPIDVSSGGRRVHRLSRRGNRRARSNARSATPSSPACSKSPARSRRGQEPGRATGEPLCIQGGRLSPRPPALRASHSRACHPPYDPGYSFSRAAAISCERAAGSRTGRSPAAQRRPQGVLDAAGNEPIMPGSGKGSGPGGTPSRPDAGRSCTASAFLT